MAVQVIRNDGMGPLGMLGTLGALGGTAFGVPWLTALGMGMSGADSLMRGKKPTTTESGGLTKILEGMGGLLKNIGTKDASDMSYDELRHKWGPNTPSMMNGIGMGWQPDGSYRRN